MTAAPSDEFIGALAWSIILVFVTIAVHISGLTCIALGAPPFIRQQIRGRNTFFDSVPGLVTTITAIAFTLAMLHGVEALIWAFAYLRLGVLNSMADAILYSVSFMSTSGSALNVQLQWRIMGAIESFDGMLLFGISTAFLFAFMRVLWTSVVRRGVRVPATASMHDWDK